MSSDLQKRLEAINELPPKGDEQFDCWLKQKDAFAFLERNAEEDELVIFASLRFTFIHAVLVPNAALDPLDVDDLLKWSCRPDRTWSFSVSRDSIGLSPPLDCPGSNALIHGEQLVFTRWFEGGIKRKHYVEVLQKFTHLFDLHYVAERDAYCRLDEHGDIEDMIRVVAVPSKDEMGRGRYVTFDRWLLDEYMLVTDTSLIRVFDFTRTNWPNFGGWTEARADRPIDRGDLHVRLTIDPPQGSYSRGFQIVRTRASAEGIRRRMWGERDEKKYASFIAQDWKHNVVTECSCDPKQLGNYFVESDLPFQISPVFFRPEVLRKYKADSEKYILEERSIRCRGSWHLKTYDINDAGQVHTYLRYLGDLPYQEQLYWKSYNEAPKAPISSGAYATDFEGDFNTEFEPLSNVKYRLKELDRAHVPWWTLRAEDLIDKAHSPVTASADEWGDDIMSLDQLLVEGFNEKWLKEKAVEFGRSLQPQWRSLKLAEECLIGLGFESDHAATIVAPLRELHELRSKLKGHASGDGARELQSKAMAEHGSYRAHFRALCARCDASLIDITAAFSLPSPGAAD
jgi:hypothetical protein